MKDSTQRTAARAQRLPTGLASPEGDRIFGGAAEATGLPLVAHLEVATNGVAGRIKQIQVELTNALGDGWPPAKVQLIVDRLGREVMALNSIGVDPANPMGLCAGDVAQPAAQPPS